MSTWLYAVAILPTASGQGYWLAASDGGVFAYGDAPFYGSVANVRLNQPVVSVASSSGKGYSLVAGDGGVFAFNETFYFSEGASLGPALFYMGMFYDGVDPAPTIISSEGGVAGTWEHDVAA